MNFPINSIILNLYCGGKCDNEVIKFVFIVHPEVKFSHLKEFKSGGMKKKTHK